MARGLKSDSIKRAEMREAYLEHRTVQAVVRLCKVSWITAEKYRVEDNWDRACARVDKLAEDIAVKRVGKRRADNLRIAQAGLVKMAKDLDTKSTIAFDANAVDRLARLVEFLSGDPDSRVDERSTQLPVSPEQIITAIRNLRKPELDKLNASLADGDTQSAD